MVERSSFHLRDGIRRLVPIALLLVAASHCEAQTESTDSAPNEKRQTSLSVHSTGVSRYLPGYWGIVGADVKNTGDATSVRSISWFDGEPGLLYGREISIPAESIRRTWFSVKAPQQPPGTKALDLNWTSIDASSGREKFEAATDFDTVESTPFTIPQLRPRIVMIGDHDDPEVRMLDLFSEAKDRIQKGIVVIDTVGRRLPPVVEGWDVADIVLLTGDRISIDTAGSRALLDWVRRGGQLWIQLDLIETSVVNDLFGQTFQIEEIDRTSVTQLTVKPAQSTMTYQEIDLNLEVPIDLVRIVADGAATTHSVNGWPAMVTSRFGRGQVSVSTLGMGGWMVPFRWMVDHPEDEVGMDVTPAAMSLFNTVSRASIDEPFEQAALEEFVAARIGYRTPARWLITTLLCAHTLLATLLAIFLRRTDRSTFMIWALPVLAVIAAVTLVVTGDSARAEPEGRQTVQFVEAERGQSRLVVDGVMAFYSKTDTEPVIGSRSNAAFIPDRSGMESTKWRIMRSDFSDWEFENLSFRPGVRLSEFHGHLSLPAPIEVLGTFDSDGFRGSLNSPLTLNAEDALIVGRQTLSLPVKLGNDGRIQKAGDVLPPGEYLAGAILGEEQTRRQSLYRNLFRTERRSRRIIQQPTMLFWSDPLDIQSGQLDADPPTGSALFAVPVTFERPEPGTRIHIPGPFIPYRSVSTRKTRGVGSYYSNSTGVWSESRFKAAPTIRFEIPAAMRPLKPESAIFRVKISAPLRAVTISAGSPDNPVLLKEDPSPVGVLEISWTDPEALHIDQDGGMYVMLTVGDVEAAAGAPIQDNNWIIDWVTLDLHAVIE